MADEITYSIALRYLKGVRKADTKSLDITGLTIDVTGTDFHVMTQTIATTATALDLGGITTPGVFVVKNLGSYYVDFHRATFTAGNGTVRLNAGEAQIFRFASTTPYAIAQTAATEIAFLLIED